MESLACSVGKLRWCHTPEPATPASELAVSGAFEHVDELNMVVLWLRPPLLNLLRYNEAGM